MKKRLGVEIIYGCYHSMIAIWFPNCSSLPGRSGIFVGIKREFTGLSNSI